LRTPRQQVRRPGLSALLLGAALILLATTAQAQVSTSLSLASDYRVRGLSWSGEQPVASLNLDYDQPSGLYAGGSATVVHTAEDGFRSLGHVEYLGLATRAGKGLSWDLGVRNQSATLYAHRRQDLQYADFYVGAVRDDVSLHIHYYPPHLSRSGSLIYVDLNGAVRRGDEWRLLGHLGVSTPLEAPGGRTGGRERYDLRLGVAREFQHCELTLAWTAAFPSLRPQFPQDSNALVVGGTFFF